MASPSPRCASSRTPSREPTSTSTSRQPFPEPTQSSAPNSAALGHFRMTANLRVLAHRRLRRMANPAGEANAMSLFSTDHRILGRRYLTLSLVAVVLGTLLSLLMRLHLVYPTLRLPILGIVPAGRLSPHGDAARHNHAVLRPHARSTSRIRLAHPAISNRLAAHGVSDPQRCRLLALLPLTCGAGQLGGSSTAARPSPAGPRIRRCRQSLPQVRARASAWICG